MDSSELAGKQWVIFPTCRIIVKKSENSSKWHTHDTHPIRQGPMLESSIVSSMKLP